MTSLDNENPYSTILKKNILSLLNGDNFGFFNREIAHLIGLNETIIFSELVAKYTRLEKCGQLTKIGEFEDYFSFSFEEIFERTTLKRKGQDSAIKKLIELGWIEKTNYGLPNTRYFRINVERIFEIDSVKNKITKLSKRDKLECPKRTNWNVQKGQSHLYNKTILLKKTTTEPAARVADLPSQKGEKKEDEPIPILEKIGISGTQYGKLKKEYSQDMMDKSFNFFLSQEKFIENPFGWLKKCLEEKWYENENKKEKFIDNNKKIAKNIEDLTCGKLKNGATIECDKEGILFLLGMHSHTIKFEDREFKDKVKKILEKMGLKEIYERTTTI